MTIHTLTYLVPAEYSLITIIEVYIRIKGVIFSHVGMYFVAISLFLNKSKISTLNVLIVHLLIIQEIIVWNN